MKKMNMPTGAKSASGELKQKFSASIGGVRKAAFTGTATRQGMTKKPMKKGC